VVEDDAFFEAVTFFVLACKERAKTERKGEKELRQA